MYNKPFMISKKKGETFLQYTQGTIEHYEKLEEIDESLPQIFLTPFSQAKERGFETGENSEKIISLLIQKEQTLTFESFDKTFIDDEISLDGALHEHFSKEEYEAIIQNVVTNEIGNGAGSNFCIAQKTTGKIRNFGITKALTIFKRLVLGEYGSYLQFIFFDGNEFFIGASPERNVSVENKIVRMNPISGTFRKAGYENYGNFKKDFLDFLKDKKEINELFMSVDEELKMMSTLCPTGGIIVGPILKEMANLIHTEYLLSGESELKHMEIFKKSMWACTVVGSPLESAFRVIKKYENFNRRYYAGAITILKNNVLDSSIMIRSVNIKNDGIFEICVGSSIVKDSVPSNEANEIKIKSKGILNSILGVSNKTTRFMENYYLDDEVQELVQKRNQNLSKLRFFKQATQYKALLKSILILNNEDDFTNMLRHILINIGFDVVIKRYSEVEICELSGFDVVLIGPGPGNPMEDSEKNVKNLEIIDYLQKNERKYFGICLGHQLICRYFHIPLQRKNIPTQGEQIEINFFGEKQKVGFYNTFAGYFQPEKDEFEFSFDINSKEIFALRNSNMFSFQFHPESILTQNGVMILKQNLEKII